jgi:hypothetical protein
MEAKYTCSRCQCEVHLEDMDKNQRDFYFRFGFCIKCQDSVYDE